MHRLLEALPELHEHYQYPEHCVLTAPYLEQCLVG
jgi:hypothetical protein